MFIDYKTMKMFIDKGTYIALEGSGFCPQHHKEQMRQKVKLSHSRKKKKPNITPFMVLSIAM